MIAYLRAFVVIVSVAIGGIVLRKASAQLPETKPQEGLRENVPRLHALTGAKIVPRAGETIPSGTVIVRDGLIEAVGADVVIPEEARQWDLSGLTIYPGFIDAYAEFGKNTEGAKPQQETHWNSGVRAERVAVDTINVSEGDLKARRGLGFTTAHLVPTGGIFRGRGGLVQLTDATEKNFVLQRLLGHHLSFTTNGSDYPKSIMGSLALVRQTFSDAQWFRRYRNAYRQQPSEIRPGDHRALNALASAFSGKKQPTFFRLRDEADVPRALAVSDQFALRRVLVDSGYAYRQAKRLRRSNVDVVISLRYPETPKVDSPDRALDLSLEHLQHWEQAPANAGVLEKQGVKFAVSTHLLGSKLGDFWPSLRRAVQHGLSEEMALRALTSVPARMLGETERLGEISNGRLANLVVAEGNLFRSKEAKIRQVWIDGHPRFEDLPRHGKQGIQGTWETAWTGADGPKSVVVSGPDQKPKLKVDGAEGEASVTMRGSDELSFKLPASLFGVEGSEENVRLTAYLNAKTMVGRGILPDGGEFSWSARRTVAAETDEVDEKMLDQVEVKAVAQYPYGAYPGRFPGLSQRKRRVFIEGATVWTCGPQGILENANVVIEDGRIVAVGRDVRPSKKSHTIDGRGKHITPGLIDCHSHTAINGGVNEGSHSVTCEVRIGDVVDPTDISIYRQLAGGLTTANLLHGSANPMGGQNQVIKLRWGKDADGLKFKGAKPGVKFALGENVKQSNWGERFNKRYPQTRMGVEQIMRDTFLAAREYGERKQRHAEQEESIPFRTDYRMEAVLEILRGERIVHIHSYRQDEILMFVRLAQEFGFTVGTFQHVLEGYKVASHLREIQAGASSFSDWWAYKFEVFDAIPYNGALLHESGVLTSFNSDNNELATRMNGEAAKAVKYGGVSPEEALKFVTINPAKQLRIDHRVGSLEVGKDADFVVWSGSPLSTLSRCEQTWIESAPYFTLESHEKRRVWVKEERRRLIGKVLEYKSKSSKKGADDTKEEEQKEPVLSIADRLRLLSPWWQYQLIDHQGLYHDGQSLDTCTGCYCDFR